MFIKTNMTGIRIRGSMVTGLSICLVIMYMYVPSSEGTVHVIPPDFNEMCRVRSSPGPTQVHCQLSSNSSTWRLSTLKTWVMSPINNQSSATYTYTITCDDTGGEVSLPWPIKCPGLIEISIDNCKITDTYSNFNNDEALNIPDHLKKIRQTNSVSVLSYTDFFKMASSVDRIDERFVCLHQSTIEEIVQRNISLAFVGSLMETLDSFFEDCINTSDSSKQDGFDYSDLTCAPEELVGKLESIPKRLQGITIKCNYVELRVLDQSMSDTQSRYSIHFFGRYHYFPKLEVVNYSSTFMDFIPKEFKDWTFTFNNLKVIDIGHNYIKEIDFQQVFESSLKHRLHVNMQYNNVTKLTLADLDTLGKLHMAFIDIRHNPINCDCELKDFLTAISKDSVFVGHLQNYTYLRDMTCATPKQLKGTMLRHVALNTLDCPVDLWPYFVVLAFVCVFLLILIVLSFVYRREIWILLVLRLNILKPRSMSLTLGDKKYHAFVSYVNEDEDWVLDVLCKQLEQPDKDHAVDQSDSRLKTEQRKTLNRFKLCLHQRDFIPGMTIIENILNSINTSKHTIIVVTKNFLKGKWSMDEFFLAYKQSLTEKRRHLIIVLLEDISEEDDLDPRLKRCMKTFTYLKASDRLFYDRLAFSLSMDTRMSNKEREQLKDSELSTECSAISSPGVSSVCEFVSENAEENSINIRL